MIRRDFLKFLGIAGAGAAVPSAVKATAKAAPIAPETLCPTVDAYSPDLMTLTFQFYDLKCPDIRENVIMSVDKGRFQYTEHKPTFSFDRGKLDVIRFDEPVTYDFELDAIYEWIGDADCIDKIHDAKYFDLILNFGNSQYNLNQCVWQTIECDQAAAIFAMSGRMSALDATETRNIDEERLPRGKQR